MASICKSQDPSNNAMQEVRCLEIFDHAELVHQVAYHSPPQKQQVTASDDGKGALLLRFMDALGPAGCGLVAVRGVPSIRSSRQALLPLARFLALLPACERSEILKAHGLGTDVSFKDPDRLVSSFASQLKFHTEEQDHTGCLRDAAAHAWQGRDAEGNSSHEFSSVTQAPNDLRQLGSLCRQLGRDMMNLGLLAARVCDIAIPGVGLEEAILQASTAKCRLIHYHSLMDGLFLRTKSKTCNSEKAGQHQTKGLIEDTVRICNDLWQQWHFDYGIFTVLTAPMFLQTVLEPLHAVAPSELKFSHPAVDDIVSATSAHTGLKVLNSGNGRVEFVGVPTDCLVLQVGEAAQISTGGRLRATAHCVCRPPGQSNLSRETFVVFLQPAWHKRLFSPEPKLHTSALPGSESKNLDQSVLGADFQEIQRKIPCLESRWQDGCTFAEFSKETTKRYYGANGVQSQK